MIKSISLVLILVIAGSIAISYAEVPGSSVPEKSAITGTWAVKDSSAKFRIYFSEGHIAIDGWDSNDGEKFIITDISWDGKRLKGKFVIPSTGYTTFSDLELVDDKTLSGQYRGDTSAGDEIWEKISD